MKLPNLVVIGALCVVGVALAASSADAALVADETLSLKQPGPELTSPVLALLGRAQPVLVATHEVSIGHIPHQGLVQESYQRRPHIQECKGGVKTAAEAVTRPNEPAYGQYRHTAGADPHVYAYC